MRASKQCFSTLLLIAPLVFLAGCSKLFGKAKSTAIENEINQDLGCGQFDAKDRCNGALVKGRSCIFDDNTNTCVDKPDCTKFSATETECKAQIGCGYFTSWRDPKIQRCLALSDKATMCLTLNKETCELSNFAPKKCVYMSVENSCHEFDEFDVKTGFNKNGLHINGTFEDDNGFDRFGYNIKTLDRYGPDDRDVEGRDRRGFDRAGRLNNGNDRDPRGFDAAGLLADGSERDARGFDAAGQWFGGALRDRRGFDVHGRLNNNALVDARGFNAAGLWADGNNHDNRGFDALGWHSNGSRRDARGFNVNGNHISGLTGYPFNNPTYEPVSVDQYGFTFDGISIETYLNLDPNYFDANGIYQGGGATHGTLWGPTGYNRSGRDRYGFNALGTHVNGTNYDDHLFDRHGNHQVTHIATDPRGFNRDGTHVASNSLYDPVHRRNFNNLLETEQREADVGRACYVPRVGDHYGTTAELRAGIRFLPAGIANGAALVERIENRCKDITGKVSLAPGQSIIAKRGDLLNQINLTNQALQSQIGADSTFHNVARDNALISYIEGFDNDHGLGRLRQTRHVRYANDLGIDAGGIRRDFKDRVSEQLKPMFNTGSDRMSLDQNFNDFTKCIIPGADANIRTCMKNVGETIAKLTFVEGEGAPHLKLSYALIAQILGQRFDSLVDVLALLKLVDPAAFPNQLRWLSMPDANLVDDGDPLFNFNEFDLPDRPVDNTNFAEYAALAIKESFLFPPTVTNAFLNGFWSIAPQEILEDLNIASLALLLEGNPTTVESVEPKIIINHNNPARSAQIKQWLIEIIREEIADHPDGDFLGNLLRFWSGSSVTPGGGQNLNIYIKYGWAAGRLPESHTCFYNFEMPDYQTKGAFKQKIIQAVTLSGGFQN